MRLAGDALELLAGAHVLGTTTPRVRRRFEALMARDRQVRAAHDRWQAQLAGLSGWAPPVRPEPQTLQAILVRTGAPPATMAGRWMRFPRSLAAALLGACLALAWVLYQGGQQPALTVHMVDAQGQGLWEFAAPEDGSRLSVTVLQPGLVPAAHALEIWALPARGGRAVSLGLLPQSRAAVLHLSEAQQLALRDAAQLAISLEPPGGSPTGVATGPVLHVAPVRRRG